MKKNFPLICRKRYLFHWLLLLLANTAAGQAQKVTGSVVDTKGQGIPGVNIRIKHSQSGTVTTPDGRYSIPCGPPETPSFSLL